MKIPAKRSHRKGFALVATLMLMILLTVIAVGLLTLSTVTLRTTGHDASLLAAKANARLALMMAIGDLQKYAGPDRRVTASASLLASGTATSVANNSWVGVWRTDDGKDGDPVGKPTVRPNGSALFDARTATAFDKKSRVLSWLVSGSDVDPEVELNDTNSVQLRSGAQPVRAPLVEVKSATKGKVAYWVSDESTKAKLNLEDPYMDQQPVLSNAESYRRLISPLTQDASVLFKGATGLKAEDASKLITPQQIALSKIASAMSVQEARKILIDDSDDFTVDSRSVLADTMHGGMKQDLTAYLEDGPQNPVGSLLGIQDADGIIDAALPNRTLSGPKYGMLRNWYALRDQVSGAMGERVISDQLPNTYGTGYGKITDPGKAFVKPLVQPVMAEAVYYLRHVIDTGTNPARVIELIYPRVVLWNPFNVKLKTSGHLVHFDFRTDQKLKVTANGKDTNFELNMNFGNALEKHLGFYIPPTSFEPGESLCFTAGGSLKITPITDGNTNLRANVLSATENPTSHKCFSREIPLQVTNPAQTPLPNTMDVSSAKITYDGNSSIIWNQVNNAPARTQGVILHSLAGSNSPVKIADLLSANSPPIVRQISLDNYSRSNNGRWLVGYTPPRTYTLAEASAGLKPDSLLVFGARFRYLMETNANRKQGKTNKEPWFCSPLVDNNVGAPNIHRWPTDNAFGLSYDTSTAAGVTGGSGPHLYAYGPIAQARQWSDWDDSEVMPHRAANGNYRTSVFTDAGSSSNKTTYPIYDLPSKSVPVASLGALQHVQLSPFAWHPTFTIGQSFPSPYLPDTAKTSVTSRTARDENTLWTNKVQYLSSQNYDITGFDKVTKSGLKDVLFNDLSFEVNEALWDRFFLSAIPRGGEGAEWSGTGWNPAKPLPNARLKINNELSNGGSKTELTNFFRASRSLWLDGGFNVNSTSIPAWESLLRSFRGINLPSRSGSSGVKDGTPYAGLLVSEGGGATSAQAPTKDEFWNGYRSLSDDEIHKLATEIVTEVRGRGPFLGVADFVNRRLVLSSDTKRAPQAYGGVIQAAIDRVQGLNDTTADYMMPTPKGAVSNYTYGAQQWGDPIQTPEPQNYNAYQTSRSSKTLSEGAGAAGHLNQGDILQQIGSVLVARGDTFVVRGYGESSDKSGKVAARAICEAVVQRNPEPISPDTATLGLNPKLPENGGIDFGRQFQILSFRWLSLSDV